MNKRITQAVIIFCVGLALFLGGITPGAWGAFPDSAAGPAMMADGEKGMFSERETGNDYFSGPGLSSGEILFLGLAGLFVLIFREKVRGRLRESDLSADGDFLTKVLLIRKEK